MTTGMTTGSILIVDDLQENLTVLRKILSQKGYRVRLAVNGRVALKTVHKELPDLILLDIMMPGIDGYEIVEILKQDPMTKHIPVIALSANVLSHDIEKGKEAGFDFYLTKPLNLAQLVTVCNQLLA